MPYRFTFKVGGIVQFTGVLACARCEGTTARGAQCRQRLCKYLPYCPAHAEALLGVRVAPSTIPGGGDGLFATRPIAAGEWIAPMRGQVVSESALDARYGAHTAPYANTVPAPDTGDVGDDVSTVAAEVIYDAALDRGIGNAANTRLDAAGRSTRAGCNAEIFADDDGEPWLAATAAIATGAEIFAFYGDGYRVEDGVEHTTVRF